MEIKMKEPITKGDYCDEETLQNISWEIIRKYLISNIWKDWLGINENHIIIL